MSLTGLEKVIEALPPEEREAYLRRLLVLNESAHVWAWACVVALVGLLLTVLALVVLLA